MSSSRFLSLALLAAVVSAISQPAYATVPYTENFTTDASNWRDTNGAVATYVPSGGPDGSSYITSTASAFFLDTGDPVVVFRGQDEFNSSADAFVGNWLADGINHFSTWVRHNAPVPLDFFVRFAQSDNFPGTAADKGALIPPNTWTQLSYDIDPSKIFNPTTNPTGYLFPEGPSSFFSSTFGNLGNIQVGYSVPAGFGLDQNSYAFALDQPSIVPEPASWFLAMSFASVAFMRRRRAA
jgi:hypothetical protein